MTPVKTPSCQCAILSIIYKTMPNFCTRILLQIFCPSPPPPPKKVNNIAILNTE